MLRGSITLSSSLPTCAVSPAETLRSLTTPSNGARTSVRCSCWRADDHARLGRLELALRVVAADLGVLERLHRGHARGAQRLQALELALGLVVGLRGGARRGLGRGQAVADRGVVQAHQQVAARAPASPFSFSTCSTTAETSARRSARRSGWTEPVIDGAGGERGCSARCAGPRPRSAAAVPGRRRRPSWRRGRALAAGGEGEGEDEERGDSGTWWNFRVFL